MRKTRKSSRRSRPQKKDERAVDVVSQLECALRHPSATTLGAAIGGIVPWFARELAHGEIPEALATGGRTLALIEIAVVLGCCAFSMLTVYRFGVAAFQSTRKALGFVAALEGVMLVSHGTTSLVALAVLVAINAIANGCVIALARDATLRRREADARRSATRARRRAPSAAARVGAAEASATRPSSPAAQAPGVVWMPRRRHTDAVSVELDGEGIYS